jgi:hypothetical protein
LGDSALSFSGIHRSDHHSIAQKFTQKIEGHAATLWRTIEHKDHKSLPQSVIANGHKFFSVIAIHP